MAFCFRSISREQIDRISPNFIYAFILTRSTLGLLQTCTSVMAIDLRLKFVSAQYHKNKFTVSPNFIYAFILTRSTLGLLAVIFGKFLTELWPLIEVRISFQLNILRNLPFLLHARRCSRAIIRFSANACLLSLFPEVVHL